MTVLSDKWIKKVAKAKGMIKPFVSKQVRKGKISFEKINFYLGLSDPQALWAYQYHASSYLRSL